MATLTRKFTVRLHDTDAAGILFFGRQFYLAHDIYEDFLAHIGFPMEKIIAEESFFVPIVHSESQYHLPMRAGDRGEITLKVVAIGNTSYTLEYQILTSNGKPSGSSKTVHVSIDRATGKKIALPEKFKAALLQFQLAP